MEYRIVRENGVFMLEACFNRGWLSRVLYGEPEWHWINTYKTLEDAQRGKLFLQSPYKRAEDWEVVG